MMSPEMSCCFTNRPDSRTMAEILARKLPCPSASTTISISTALFRVRPAAFAASASATIVDAKAYALTRGSGVSRLPQALVGSHSQHIGHLPPLQEPAQLAVVAVNLVGCNPGRRSARIQCPPDHAPC